MEPTLDGSVYRVMHWNARSGRMILCRKPFQCRLRHYITIPIDIWKEELAGMGFAGLNERKSERQTRTPFRIPAVSDTLRGGDVEEDDELPF